MATIVDPINDQNKRTFYSVFQDFEVPAYVNDADALTKEAAPAPAGLYALPTRRLFPIDTQANTWLSWAYLKQAGGEIDASTQQTALRNIQRAAAVWGVVEPQPKMEQKVAADDAPFSVSYVVDGHLVHKAAIATANDLQKCAQHLVESGIEMPWKTRQSVANQVLKIASDMNFEFDQHGSFNTYKGSMDDMLRQAAGRGCSSILQVDDAIRSRKNIALNLGDEGLAYKLGKVAECVHRTAVDGGLVSPDVMHKTASVLDAIDRMAMAHDPKYRPVPVERHLTYMNDRQYDYFRKQAVELRNGKVVPAADLAKGAAAELLRDICGKVPASQKEAQDMVDRLPDRTSARLAELIAQEHEPALVEVDFS